MKEPVMPKYTHRKIDEKKGTIGGIPVTVTVIAKGADKKGRQAIKDAGGKNSSITKR